MATFQVKNKTSKNIVLLVDGHTEYLYPKGNDLGRDIIQTATLSPQIKSLKQKKIVQITKIN